MKNIKLYIVIGLLAVGCTLLLMKCLKQRSELAGHQNQEAKVAKAIVTEAKEISRKVDEKGIEQVLYDVTGNKATQEQLLSSASTKGIIDTTAMALDIRTKQLQQILVVKGSLEAENLRLRKQLDAYNRPYYTYRGQGLDLKFTPPYNELDTTDQGMADFTADVRISANQYWKRDWFLGSKRSILAISSNSPLFKINGADFVEFEQKQPTLGLRLQANAAFNTESGEISYGPALRVDLGRLSFQGRYSKYPNDPTWKTTFNASYDLLRF